MTGINPTSIPVSGGSQMAPAASSNPRLKALEQKLEKLKKEKEEAVHNNDGDKKRELEKEIQKVEQQIEQLKRKEKQKKDKQDEKEEGKGNLAGYGQKIPDAYLGNVMDLYG